MHTNVACSRESQRAMVRTTMQDVSSTHHTCLPYTVRSSTAYAIVCPFALSAAVARERSPRAALPTVLLPNTHSIVRNSPTVKVLFSMVRV